MIWGLTGLLTILSVELVCRLPVIAQFRQLASVVSRSGWVLKSSRISDHWKERVLPAYSLKMFKHSLAGFILLVLALSPFLAASLLTSHIGLDFIGFIAKPIPIIAITVFAWMYYSLRKNWGYLFHFQKHQYGLASRVLHHLALNSNSRCEMFFDMEKAMHLKKATDSSEGSHVFVCGLARAGTTVLMRSLFESGQFASLTYRDMPFVLAPNLWAGLSGQSQKSMEKTVRAHNDGIMVDFDSPEALEEVFWRVFVGEEYLHSDRLAPHKVDQEVATEFTKYVSLINQHYSKNRYLSKNNNNILRLPEIARIFPKALILIPFREPLQHAFSLLKQHQNFMAQNQEDIFSLKYMNWLVHHEFGQDHRPFVFPDSTPAHGKTSQIDYWVQQWVNAYSHLLDQVQSLEGNVLLVGYEDLCSQDGKLWEVIAKAASLPLEYSFEFRQSRAETPQPTEAPLIARAQELYESLGAESRRRLDEFQ